MARNEGQPKEPPGNDAQGRQQRQQQIGVQGVDGIVMMVDRRPGARPQLGARSQQAPVQTLAAQPPRRLPVPDSERIFGVLSAIDTRVVAI